MWQKTESESDDLAKHSTINARNLIQQEGKIHQ